MDKSSYTLTTGLVTILGNWSADKPTYATVATVSGKANTGGSNACTYGIANFSIFNSTTSDSECESTNQTGPITYGAQPAVGVNNTAVDILLGSLAIGQGSQESLYYCLFDVPAAVQSENYDTTNGGSWDITCST